MVPTVRVWTGASGIDANWMTAANWVGGVAPSPGDDLVFAGGALQAATSNNNFTAGTAFNSISLDAAGYTLSGNGVTLGPIGLTVNSAAGAGNDTVNFDISTGAGAGTAITDTYTGVALDLAGTITAASGQTVTFGGSGPTTVLGNITGAGNVAKAGPGTVLVEQGSRSGTTTINAGILQLANGATLGSGPVTVSAGATLQLLDGANVSESLILNGAGVGGGLPGSTVAALEVSGSSTVSGTITLGSDAAIGTDTLGVLNDTNTVALAGHTLTVNSGAGTSATFDAAIADGGSPGNLVVNSALTTGTVFLAAANTYSGSTTVEGGSSPSTPAAPSSTPAATRSPSAAPSRSITAPASTPTASATARASASTAAPCSSWAATAPPPKPSGRITLAGGHSTIRITPGTSTVVTAAGLVRDAGATVNFNSTGVLGSATDKLLFTTRPPTATTGGGPPSCSTPRSTTAISPPTPPPAGSPPSPTMSPASAPPSLPTWSS